MANRYWVGGTASWDSAAGTKWSTTSGGAGGASVPTSADDVFFTNLSTGTCSIAFGNAGAKSINCTGFAGTLSGSANITVSGSVTLSAGMTMSYSGILVLNGTGALTSNGKTFHSITVDGAGITVSLADNITLSNTLRLQSGSFDAVAYDVTTATFVVSVTGSSPRVLKMGSGLWTLTGGGLVSSDVWNVDVSGGTSFELIKGSANIVLSDTSTAGRAFRGGGFSYNKLTIGGATGTSNLSITGNNQFTELASIKTVAHTIDLGSTTQVFGKWTVTGTAGNVVTLTGTGTGHILAGACTSGIDYLAMGSIGFAATSPGEFYAGANSTGTAGAPVYRTAKPADSTRYWVGGTGNWSDTARWATSSGGASGAAVPRSHDDVIFDSASNATAYTATVNAVTGGIRMKSLTIAGPASGNVTLAGSAAIDGIHGNITLPTTGLTRTYTGSITLSSSSTGLTFTTNGVVLSSSITVNGVDCGWSLGSPLNIGTSRSFIVTNGSFDFAGHNYTGGDIFSGSSNTRTINLGSSTISVASTFPIQLGTTEASRASLTFNANTSQIDCSANGSVNFAGNGKTFYNVSFTSTSNPSISISGANTYNNLTVAGLASVGLRFLSFGSNQTVSGTLTLSANAGGNSRTRIASPTTGSALTLTCNAVSALQDIDFRDVVIAGAAVSGGPISGTRLGDCGGNSGLVFGAAKTVYYVNATSGNWSDGWSFTSGGSASTSAFPLAQDTAIIEAAYPTSGSTISMNYSYAIGTINMSGRTSSLLVLNLAGLSNEIYGDWINGTGVTITGASFSFQGPVFLGRSTQTITSAGKSFPGKIQVSCVGGSVVLADNLSLSGEFRIYGVNCTFNANNKNVTVANSVDINSTSPGTINIGDEVWTVGDSWLAYTPFTVTGSGTIRMTKGTAKSFVGGGASYGNVVLEQAGNGPLTITGNNTFRSIASSVSVSNTISMSGTTQTITGQWTAKGSAGNLLTISGGSLVGLPTGVSANIDYVNIVSNSASPANSWYAGPNSVNSGSSGWIFAAAPVSAGFFMLL